MPPWDIFCLPSLNPVRVDTKDVPTLHIHPDQRLLYSHRRQGKSSLIQQVFAILDKKKPGIGKMHIDLYGTVSEQDFIIKVFKGLSQMESNMDKLFKTISSAVKTFRFTLTVDPLTSQPSISLSFEAVKEETMLEELMTLLDRYSQKKKLVIALDEFQEVATYTEVGWFENRIIGNQGTNCFG